MSKRFYRAELDALRFFAFLSVFFSHVIYGQGIPALSSMGAFGVSLFFLLSAYLIISLLVREKESTGDIAVGAFAVRRILRIWPLYFFGIGIGLLSRFMWPDMRLPWPSIAAMFLLVTNIYVLRHGWIYGIMGQFWTIAIEEQFYAVIPWLAKFGTRRVIKGAMWAALAVSEVTVLYVGWKGGSYTRGLWANSFVQFQFFAAGGLIALHFDRSGSNHIPLLMRGVMVIAGVVAWYEATVRFNMREDIASTPATALAGMTLVLVGTVLFFLAALEIPLRIPSALKYLGKISYGLYIFHPMIIRAVAENQIAWSPVRHLRHHVLARSLAAFVLTIVVAALSYQFLESPFLKLKGRFERIRTRTV